VFDFRFYVCVNKYSWMFLFYFQCCKTSREAVCVHYTSWSP